MLKKSYLNNYFQSYLWKFIAMTSGILSMIIVVPALSDNKVVYGVYSVCISINIFLSYADIGFFSAGMKYAGESFARNDRKEEYTFFGFACFILFIFITLVAIVYGIFAYDPSLLISDIKNNESYSIATKLLIIQAVFSYNTLFSRLVDGIFGIRIESYVFQKILIPGHVIKIISIFYFFADQKYDIVSYFLFTKIVDFICNIIGLFIIKSRYEYSFSQLIKAFTFDKEIYRKTKHLAFGSLFGTLMWIIYYELDTIAISKLLGSASVAIFSVGFVFANYFRSLLSILYSPFQARYNQLVGIQDLQGLKTLNLKVIRFTLPVIIFSIVSIVLLSKNIVVTWVGTDYEESILILRLLMLSPLLSFISIPAANLIVSLVKIKSLYLISITGVVIFWAGILLTINIFGVYSFPLFKIVSNFVAAMIYLHLLLGFLEIGLYDFFKQTILKVILPIGIQIIFLLLIADYLPGTKGRFNLLVVILAGMCSTLVGFIALYLSSLDYKEEVNHYFSKILVGLKAPKSLTVR